jgi:hypothetical protein
MESAPLIKLKKKSDSRHEKDTRTNSDDSSGGNSGAAAYASAVQPTCEMREGAYS